MRGETVRPFALAVILALAVASEAISANCSVTSIGATPLNDLASGLYLGQFEGGLYPNGLNTPPPSHDQEGRARALAIGPISDDPGGGPTSRYILLSVGMSNTEQEFSRFVVQADADPRVNQTELVIINGAFGGNPAQAWESPTAPSYDRIVDDLLLPNGWTEAQVVAAWVKQANPNPVVALPDPSADAIELLSRLGNIVRAMQMRYPNLRIVFFSSRIYAGYASSGLNPEPYAYETAFAAKWLIEAQIGQMTGGGIDPVAGDLDYSNGTAPWLAWGPYLWADGLDPRSDGVIWQCNDLADDGTHPSPVGQEKVAKMLLDFMLVSPFSAPWFREGGSQAEPVPALSARGAALLALLILVAGSVVVRRAGWRRGRESRRFGVR